MFFNGRQFPSLISTLSPEEILSPTEIFLGDKIYLNSPSSYLISDIKADLFGSYSFLITSALISNLFLLKSISLYFLFTPPPFLLDVILPWLFLPPDDLIGFVRDLNGSSLDKCFEFPTK